MCVIVRPNDGHMGNLTQNLLQNILLHNLPLDALLELDKYKYNKFKTFHVFQGFV